MERKILAAIVVSATLVFVILLGIFVLLCFWCINKRRQSHEDSASKKGILQDARKKNGITNYKTQLSKPILLDGSRSESPAQTSTTTPLSTPRRPSGIKDVAEPRTIGMSPSKSVEGEGPVGSPSSSSDRLILPSIPQNKNLQAIKNAEHPSMAFWQNRSLSLVDMYIDNAEPSETCGQIQFNIEYDFEKNTLILRVLQAKDLPAMDLTGTSDPYVKVTLLPDKKHKLETKIKRRTLNPKWNETFYFEGFPIQKLQTRVLHLHVFDYDRFSRDDSIGEVFVPLCQIDLTSKPMYWRALKPPPKYKCGEILISLCYHPANSLLTLTALKARNLKAKDINGKSDPYVKVWLQFGDKKVEKRKTPVFPCTLEPVFNETFTFHVPWEKIRDCSLDVRVMDFDNIGRNELIGRLCLAKKGDIRTKTEAIKKIIKMTMAGEKPNLLMHIIRFVLPEDDHFLKKLLLIYWEIVPKTTPDGKLLQEMILVCNAYLKDLKHPNEFVRGSTLRFLCKLKEPELLEPLMPAIRSCLDHRHSYVRRNAVLALCNIYRNFDFLIPDAPEIIANYLEKEQDMSCKRNAFLMLIHTDQQRALDYLTSCIDQVQTFGEILQLVIVELIYKVCNTNPSERARFIRCIYNLLNSTSAAVRYEAAGTLVTLSNASTAIKAAATCYIDLIIKESDNNVKLIVLDRLVALKDVAGADTVLQGLVMDILRVLAVHDLEVQKKTLNLALELVSSRNVEEMVMLLKKELARTHNTSEHEDMGRYRQLLIKTLHSCSIKFPDVAASVIPMLMEFLSDQNEMAAMDVLVFVREAVQKLTGLRALVVEKLLESFLSIRSVKVHRAALWILAEFSETPQEISDVMQNIRQALGKIPLVDDEAERATGEETSNPFPASIKPAAESKAAPKITADGTYATQSSYVTPVASTKTENIPSLRKYMLEGDFMIGVSIASGLVKLALKFEKLKVDSQKVNSFSAEAMMILSSILRLGKSAFVSKKMNNDEEERIQLCLRALSERCPILLDAYVTESRKSVSQMLEAKLEEEAGPTKTHARHQEADFDDQMTFSCLSSRTLGNSEDVFEVSLSQAVGTAGGKKDGGFDSTKLSKVTQLTGFSDPVYAEAYVNVNQFDIVLDVLIVNQTGDTLQNCTLELATIGDLKLVEKPSSVVLAPHDFINIRASVKVASTENGIIFGNIVYDVIGSQSDRNVVIINDIHIDIMDYIVPSTCTDAEFRQMWSDFEWENKVTVNTSLSDLHAYLEHLLKSTNMKCMTPKKALAGDCGVMAANLYAKSIFGEDALANVSIEKPFGKDDAAVVGHIRIRAKSQGMALSLGDKVNAIQKIVPKATGA